MRTILSSISTKLWREIMPAINLAQLEANAFRAAVLLKLMGNPSRLLILCKLSEGEKSVGELQDVVGLRQSTLSQHLALLRHERIVSTRRSAQTIYYSLVSRETSVLLATLYGLFCSKKSIMKRHRLKTSAMQIGSDAFQR